MRSKDTKQTEPEDKLALISDEVKNIQQIYSALESKYDHATDIITTLNCRLTIRNEMIAGCFEKHMEDCRRKMRTYKKSTTEYKTCEALLDILIDVRRDILNC